MHRSVQLFWLLAKDDGRQTAAHRPSSVVYRPPTTVIFTLLESQFGPAPHLCYTLKAGGRRRSSSYWKLLRGVPHCFNGSHILEVIHAPTRSAACRQRSGCRLVLAGRPACRSARQPTTSGHRLRLLP